LDKPGAAVPSKARTPIQSGLIRIGNAELPVSARISLRAALNCTTVMPGISRRSVGMAEDRVREKDFNLHATYSFVFLMGAAFCSRFCSSSSGTRLTGPCMIERARARRTRTRDSSSSSNGPKTSKTIIANENHSLIAPHFFARLAQKKSPQDRAGTRCAVADQRHRVKSEACGCSVHIFLRWAAKFHRSVQLVQDCPPMASWRTSGEFEIWARSCQVIVARGVSKADRHLRAPTRWSDDVSL
jgi:hypothetical protein